MNAEVKVKWVKALRSGEYVQGTGVLRDQDNRYCCLGVLCDVVGMEWGQVYTEANYTPDDGDSDCFPPASVVKTAGMDGDDPFVNYITHGGEKDCDSLSSLNDAGYTFEEIATLIEEQL